MTLHRLILIQIIGAPSFFPTVWGWIKRWFDPITTSKIFILSHSQVKSTLERFIDVDSIPKKYGGALDFECGMLPNLDPKIRKVLDLQSSEEDFLTAPVRWIEDERGELIAVGVGSIDGRPRQETAALLHTQARLTLVRSATQQRVPQVSVSQTLPIASSSQPSTQTNSVTNLSRQTTQPDSAALTPATEGKPFFHHNATPKSPLVNSELASKPAQRADPEINSSGNQDFLPNQEPQSPVAAPPQVDGPAANPQLAPPSVPTSATITAPRRNGTSLPDRTVIPQTSNGLVHKDNESPQLPPSNIKMSAKTEPPPMTRSETVYMTPPGDPSEAFKQLS